VAPGKSDWLSKSDWLNRSVRRKNNFAILLVLTHVILPSCGADLPQVAQKRGIRAALPPGLERFPLNLSDFRSLIPPELWMAW
jgi:hypothetical protein